MARVLGKKNSDGLDEVAAQPKRRRRKSRVGHVLIVEDDPVLAISLEETLKEAGASKIVIAPTTAAAMAALEELRPNILILDVHLADRDDGWAVAELVTQLWPSPPMIMFSTATPDAIPEEIAALGTVLKKPYDSDRLLSAIAEATKAGGLLAKLKAVVPGTG